jgi:hypothetical protein
VTLTTTPPELYAHHDHVLRVLIQAMASGAWKHDTQVLVLHPRAYKATLVGTDPRPMSR